MSWFDDLFASHKDQTTNATQQQSQQQNSSSLQQMLQQMMQQQGQQQAQSSTQEQNPWGAQSPYLTQGFKAASDALAQSNKAPTPTSFIAGLTPEQNALYHSMFSTGSTAANNIGSTIGTGTGAYGNGISGLSNYSATPFSSILSNAAMAANDPSIQGRIDAASRDATRSAQELLRQNNQGAAATGNVNSSRAGATDAIIGSRLAQNVGDISANIRGQAYDRGLSSALSSAQFGDQSHLSALQQLMTGGLAGQAGGVSNLGGLFNLANTGATGLQTGNQLGLNNTLAANSFFTQQPFAGLNQFWNIVGNPGYGGTTTSSGTGNTNGYTSGISNGTVGNNTTGTAGHDWEHNWHLDDQPDNHPKHDGKHWLTIGCS
jgi:hypothetical protein